MEDFYELSNSYKSCEHVRIIYHGETGRHRTMAFFESFAAPMTRSPEI